MSVDLGCLPRMRSHAALALTLCLPACATLFGAGHATDRGCPRDTEQVDTAEARYCVATCVGILEDGVRFAGLSNVVHYDGAEVFAIPHQNLDGTFHSPPTSVPEEVCRRLPHGCACSDRACLWVEERERRGREFARQPSTSAPFPARCEGGDPACGPEAFSHQCLDRAGYRAGRQRTPVFGRQRQQEPNCSHDGECIDSGCGYGCLSVRAREDPSIAALCLRDPKSDAALADAFCGCVEGSCRWFTQ
jgi:hypothetical protein